MGKSKFTFRVDTELLKKMKIKAITENMPLNELLERAFETYCIMQEMETFRIDENDVLFTEDLDDSEIPF